MTEERTYMVGNRNMFLASDGQYAHELLERFERRSELELELHLREALEVYKRRRISTQGPSEQTEQIGWTGRYKRCYCCRQSTNLPLSLSYGDKMGTHCETES